MNIFLMIYKKTSLKANSKAMTTNSTLIFIWFLVFQFWMSSSTHIF